MCNQSNHKGWKMVNSSTSAKTRCACCNCYVIDKTQGFIIEVLGLICLCWLQFQIFRDARLSWVKPFCCWLNFPGVPLFSPFNISLYFFFFITFSLCNFCEGSLSPGQMFIIYCLYGHISVTISLWPWWLRDCQTGHRRGVTGKAQCMFCVKWLIVA